MGISEENNLANKFFNKIKARMLFQNKNWLAVVCGETGSGKSYSALQMANIISPRGITIKRNVVFNAVQFLNRINNPEGLKKGDIIIFDEAGVGMSSREWYSLQNKLFGSVLQTFRNLNVGVIFTTPNLSFIDVQARKLLHNYFETANIDYKEQIAYMKVYNIEHNSRYDKTYFKHPRFQDSNGRIIKTRFLGLQKINEQLAKEYERVKSEYTRNLNQKALEELTKKKEKKTKLTNFEEDEKIEKDLKKNYKKYVKQKGNRKYLDHPSIMSNYKIAHNRALRIKHNVEKEIGLST